MDKDLIISAPRQGIGPSPHVGFGDVRNLDIFTSPGVAILNNAVANRGTTTALVQWFAKNPLTPTEIFALDSSGQVYKSTNSGTSWATVTGETTGGHGNGMAIWKDYLFVARDAYLDVYGPLSSSPSWSNSWSAITLVSDSLWHPMLVSKNDNKLYIGAGRYIASLDEITAATFLPGTSNTYTAISQALDLPPNYRIKCLEELGNNLMIGTWMGTNIYDFKIADIFPWDRSLVSFGQPIQMVENGVNAMLNAGNYLIVMAGIGGAIYRSDGVNSTQIAQIPNSLANLDGGAYLTPYPGALVNYKGRVFFGVSGASAGMGVYSLLQTSKGNILNFEHTISIGGDDCYIGALLGITRDNLLIGWSDTTFGIDSIDIATRTTSYGGYFDSPLYIVGTNLNKRSFTQLEFQLAQALRTGEGIRVKYRTDLNTSFTTIGTYDYSTLGAVISHNTTADIPETEFVQVRVELTGTTSPIFKSLTLK